MKNIFVGCVAASFLVVSCSGGDQPVAVKGVSPAVESAASEKPPVDIAAKSALTEQLVGDYKGMSAVSDESRERVLSAVGNTDLLDERLGSWVVDVEMRADGTCTYTWTQGDEPLINEGTWVVTDDLAHVTISMEGNAGGYFVEMGVWSHVIERDFLISDDKKTLSYSVDSFGMENIQSFIRK